MHTPEEIENLRRSYQAVLDNPAYGLGQKDMARPVLALCNTVNELRAGLLHIFAMTHDPAVEAAISALLATEQKEVSHAG